MNSLAFLLWLWSRYRTDTFLKTMCALLFLHRTVYHTYSTLWCQKKLLHWKHAVNSLSILFCFLYLLKNIASFLYKWDVWKCLRNNATNKSSTLYTGSINKYHFSKSTQNVQCILLSTRLHWFPAGPLLIFYGCVMMIIINHVWRVDSETVVALLSQTASATCPLRKQPAAWREPHVYCPQTSVNKEAAWTSRDNPPWPVSVKLSLTGSRGSKSPSLTLTWNAAVGADLRVPQAFRHPVPGKKCLLTASWVLCPLS